MFKENKKQRGFTLIELLAVIVVLAIILVIAVPRVIDQIEKAKQRAYFISVSNIVDSLKTENVLEEKDYCMYDYSQDTVNQTENIDKMYILAHMENSKIIYSVYATKGGQNTINAYDFSKLNIDKPDDWEEELGDKSSYTSYNYEIVADLVKNGESESGSLFNKFKKCGLSK